MDAGSRSGRSSRWLAERWPQALVVALVLRPDDEALMAHTTAGTTVQRLHSLPVAGAELRADDIWGLGLPLEKLPLWIGAHGGEPALLHLDAAMAETEAWFAQGGAWLRPFAVVLLHGALASDEQGRILPQPHQAALAAAGFEMVRSGEVLVAFQRLLLEPSAGVLAHPGKELPALEGKIRQQGGVVAFDGEWQYPAITEQWACHQAMARLGPHPDQVYVGFPWASLIDHLNNGTLRGRALLLELQRLLALLEGRGRRITVCQQIFFQEHRWLFELAGITDVFWPHATIHSSLPGIRLHPFPLYPVHWRPSRPEQPRDLLYSFIGAKTTRLYLSNSRDLILSNLAGLPGSLIEGYEGWFFDALVYGVQIRSELKADDPRVAGEERLRQQERYIESLQRSLFVICPSGTGPNTIRLWEALASGAIPIVLADTWRPPGPRELWEEAVFFLPDTPQGVMTIPRLAAEWARAVPLLERKRAAMARLWQRYGPDGFIGDIEALWA
ncbi:exostosin family protein [Cyanobium sp. LEGE 06143]|uniref:exostosin domain-containing protein n=1 Tax=Cyanobium sp. LEGE 06143 TaxID=945727 RepID=UPI00187E17DF|nr:exostosin family protein [Cyanobium sp. LEGE 06143]MBE9172107.1 exostosin family protein [Cyanobium sp. LEGE 06143]